MNRMSRSAIFFFFGVYLFDYVYAFSLNPSGNGDPAPGRSPGPPILEEDSFNNVTSKCRLNGTINNEESEIVRLSVSHALFKTDVLVPGVDYQGKCRVILLISNLTDAFI